MKKLILMAIALIIIGSSFAFNVIVNLPTQVGKNSSVSAYIKLNGSADKVDIGVIMPNSWKLSSWDVYGIPKFNAKLKYEDMNGSKVPHLMISNVVEQGEIKLNFVQSNGGTLKFIITYKSGSDTGFFFVNKSVKVKSVICGNGICEPGENSQNCPVDCQVAKHTSYLSLIALTILIIGGIGFWIWRRYKW